MKIELSSLTNSKLLLNFPTDPYADILIKSTLYEYQLQIAFLSIESQFFESAYTNHTRQLDLRHLPEPYLQNILKSLYGDSLIVESFSDLSKYYFVIKHLRINEYFQRLVESLRNDMKHLNPIELLEFCYSNRILLSEVKQIYLEDNLQILQDQKYYLQLNKIQPTVMLELLNQYLQESECPTREAIIDSVLDNYFSRNKIEPYTFFQKHNQTELLGIWQRAHQSTFYDQMLLQTLTTESDQPQKSKLVSDYGALKAIQRFKQLETEFELQAQRIKELQKHNQSYRQTIALLQKENLELKIQNSHQSPIRLRVFEPDESTSSKKSDFIMVQSYMPETEKKLEKTFVHCLCGQLSNQEEFEVADADLAYGQLPVISKLVSPPQVTKTMNQLKTTHRNKKIFS